MQLKNDLKITNPIKCGLSGCVKPRITGIKLAGLLQRCLVLLVCSSRVARSIAPPAMVLQQQESGGSGGRPWSYRSSIFQPWQCQQMDLWCKKHMGWVPRHLRGMQLAQQGDEKIRLQISEEQKLEILDPKSYLPSLPHSPLDLMLINSAAHAQLDPDPEEIDRNCQVLHPLKIRSCVYVTYRGFRSQLSGTLCKSWYLSVLYRLLAIIGPDELP